MAEEEGRPDRKEISREQRLERIRKLLEERGEDAGKIVKTWLAKDAGTGGRR
mgnify:CR=1 FL=1